MTGNAQPPQIAGPPVVERPIAELIRTRRAVRHFEDRGVPEELVREVLEAGRWAPSPANLQPARFVRVIDPLVRRRLQELAQESKELSGHWDPVFRPGGSSGLVNDLLRPEVIAVCADPSRSLTNVHADGGFEWAAAMAIYAMWLRAHSLGLGGVFVQHWITEKAKAILDIPLRWTFLGVFTFGYAAAVQGGEGAPVRGERLPLEELVFLDRFGSR